MKRESKEGEKLLCDYTAEDVYYPCLCVCVSVWENIVTSSSSSCSNIILRVKFHFKKVNAINFLLIWIVAFYKINR